MHIDRLPGFAICGSCGARGKLGSCARCGILSCRECGSPCRACRDERAQAEARARRLDRIVAGVHTLGVAACIAATGMAALGAALLPDADLIGPTSEHLALVARSEVRFVADALDAWSREHHRECPDSLLDLRREGLLLTAPIDPWGEALVFGCVEGPRAYVVMSKGPDREAGTSDDLLFAWP